MDASVSHYITNLDAEGTSSFLDAPNPLPDHRGGPQSHINYIYSTAGSPAGPVFKDQEDYKQHQVVAALQVPIMCPAEGNSSAIITTVCELK